MTQTEQDGSAVGPRAGQKHSRVAWIAASVAATAGWLAVVRGSFPGESWFVAALWIVTAGAVLVTVASGLRAAGNRGEPKPVATMALIVLAGAVTSVISVSRYYEGPDGPSFGDSHWREGLGGMHWWAFYGAGGMILLTVGVLMWRAASKADMSPPPRE